MAGIIERNANVAITLKTRRGVSDGKPSWQSTQCNCMFFESVRDKEGNFGSISVAKVFLLPPLFLSPSLPAIITHSGVDYDISYIKSIRNINGDVLGFKMVSFGG